MVNWSLLLVLGLVNWFSTFLLVESEFFRPYRQFVDNRFNASLDKVLQSPEFFEQFASLPSDTLTTESHGEFVQQQIMQTLEAGGSKFWREARYFVHCHTCTGTWVGFALAAVAVHPLVLHGFVGFVVSALAIKALGHITLDVVAVLKGNQ